MSSFSTAGRNWSRVSKIVAEDVPEGDFARCVAVEGPIAVREEEDATDRVRFGETWGGHKVRARDLQHAGKLLPTINFRVLLEHLDRSPIELLYRLQLVDADVLQLEDGQHAVDRRVLLAAVEDKAPEPRVGLGLDQVSNQPSHTGHDPGHMAAQRGRQVHRKNNALVQILLVEIRAHGRNWPSYNFLLQFFLFFFIMGKLLDLVLHPAELKAVVQL
ncbi:hypothetical protein KL928_000197 [Ogataea angusta]|uniref:Uncharacterized protein n=1 Tax=Pichia angusta TaxID=870730 RepID=A0AAN6I7L7_PICAN|nr:uncharacterized protein KL928_000197 [Ogataea angusta]KAG7821722.1 hypothetical protein KL928_000197 [Ogataea angusta]